MDRSYEKLETPFKLYEIGIINSSDEELCRISEHQELNLNLDEMKAIQRYFTSKSRNPTDIELQTIGQTWSEHCFHKTFKGEITTESGKIDSLFKTYISKSTEELELPWCFSVFEDNAGIVDFEGDYAIAAKVETHNHPSAIEPFGGAATGVGGVIRDILGVWADPIACTNVLCFGPLNYKHADLPPSVKHPKYLFTGVVAGIGFYGNNMGIPTVNGAICFDMSYVGNVVVYCGCVGVLPKSEFNREVKDGDIILLVGGKTGRDGIHGVTFASAVLTEKSEETSRSAVQIANPIEEEKLKRAIMKVRMKKLGSSITDLGGGGLSSAIGELANRFRLGARVKLDKVPLKTPDIAPWEIYVSESQERMLLAIAEDNLQEVINIFNSEDIEASPIGKFVAGKTLEVFFYGHKVADLDVDFLFKPPRKRLKARWSNPCFEDRGFPEPQNLTEEVLKSLSAPNTASRETVIRTYDHEVKGSTVLKPLQGEFGGPNDAAVIKPLKHSLKGIVISSGINPRYGKIDPYWMAASAIEEAIRNNTAVGGRRIALLDNFTWGNPENPEALGGLVRACEACYTFATYFKTPFISGKDSLYNESPLGPVTPTLLITALGTISDVEKCISMDLKTPGNTLYLVGLTYPELGGSEYFGSRNILGKNVPKVRTPNARKNIESVADAIDARCVKTCHDLSGGGLATAAAEMALTSNHGLEMHLKNIPTSEGLRDDFILFSESNSRFLVEVPESRREKFEGLMKETVFKDVGKVSKTSRFVIYGCKGDVVVEASLKELREHWKKTLWM